MKRSFLLVLCLLTLSVSAWAEPSKKVEVFVTSWCPYCRKLETFLKDSGIDYTRYDVEADAKAGAEFERLGGSGVPVVRIGKDVIHGYDPQSVLASLKAQS